MQHTAQLFFEHVWKHYGLPMTIIYDKYARFSSIFWKTLWENINMRLSLSTSFHPQKDGSCESLGSTTALHVQPQALSNMG